MDFAVPLGAKNCFNLLPPKVTAPSSVNKAMYVVAKNRVTAVKITLLCRCASPLLNVPNATRVRDMRPRRAL